MWPLIFVTLHTQTKSIELPSMRIELTTLGLLDPRSNQLSYEGFPLLTQNSVFYFAM